MAISLLAKMNQTPGPGQAYLDKQKANAYSSVAPKSQVVKGNYGYSQVPTSTPMGVKAKTPVNNAQVPSTILPQAQQQPIASKAISDSTKVAQDAAKTIGGSYVQGVGYVPGSQPAQAQQPSFTGYLKQLIDTATSGNKQANEAYQQAQAVNAALAKSKKNEAATLAGIANEAIPLEFQQGRQQVAQTQYQAQQEALAGQLQGAASLYGTAMTGQGQQLGALQQAAGYTQPQVTSYGQTVFNPATGSFQGASNLDPQTQASNLAQKVISGQMTYDQALSSMGYAGNAGTTFLNNAITGAGGNPLQLQAQGNTQQTVIGNQQQQIATYKSALQQGQNLQSQLSDLITTFGLNPADLNAVNIGLQKIAKNTSSPQYQILQNYINDVANTYAQVLTPPGGSATDTTRAIATSMLDATASGKSILTVMQSLDAAANAKIAGVSTTGIGNSIGGTVVQTSAGAINTNW